MSPAQFGLFAATPNISHGSMPFVLLILYALAWLGKSKFKYPLICLLNFLMIYTGFGFFIGPITILLFLFDFFHSPKKERISLGIALIFSLLSLAVFFVDYNFHHPEELAEEVSNSSVFSYLAFILVCLANYWSLIITNVWDYLFGAMNLILIAFLLFQSMKSLRKDPMNQSQRVIFILSAFTLLFLIGLALGRAPYGIGGAKASRYVIYFSPAYIALYLYIDKIRFGTYFWKFIFATAVLYPTFNTSQYYRKMESLKTNKMNWVEAYKETEDIEKANLKSNSKIFPKPDKIGLKNRLEYLKTHQLNLYKTESEK